MMMSAADSFFDRMAVQCKETGRAAKFGSCGSARHGVVAAVLDVM
jgi:hypothetical protein